MIDREKVIKGLECCLHGPMQCEKCPYMSEVGKTVPNCVKTMRTDALSLLKSKEPIEPIEIYDDTKCVEDHNRTLAWKCGKCGYYIGGADNFCANCGQAVKWE